MYLFEEELPVDDSFRFSYGGLNSDDWQNEAAAARPGARPGGPPRARYRDGARLDCSRAARHVIISLHIPVIL